MDNILETLQGSPYLSFVLLFSTAMYLFDDVYVSLRQRACYRITSVPTELKGIIEEETFTKARSYSLDKNTYGLCKNLFSHVQLVTVLLIGWMPLLWQTSGDVLVAVGVSPDSQILRSIVFLCMSTLVDTLIELPWNIYATFVLEQKHGFNKQTPYFFFKDQVKSIILSLVITALVASGVLYVVQWGGEYFFIYAWAFVFAVCVFFFAVYADFIAPLFDEFTELPVGELRTQIEKLASSLRFPLTKLYMVNGSKRSAHSNAYFYGFFNNKRIVIFDTLLQSTHAKAEEAKATEANVTDGSTAHTTDATATATATDKAQKTHKKTGCTNEEIVAVLAHELGHWQHNHVLKMFAISQVNIFLMFYTFSFFMNNPALYTNFGFETERPLIVGLIVVFSFILAPFNLFMQFLTTAYSRHNEFQADRFAKDKGFAALLRSSLVKLNEDNLSFPVHDWLFSTLHHSHPTLMERLRALDKAE